jgi:hypothetical protein
VHCRLSCLRLNESEAASQLLKSRVDELQKALSAQQVETEHARLSEKVHFALQSSSQCDDKAPYFLKCVCFVFQETASALRSRMQQQQQEHAVEVQSLLLEHESARNSLHQKVQHLQACLA